MPDLFVCPYGSVTLSALFGRRFFFFAPDTFLISGISVIGSALRSTISPVLARAMLLGLVKRVFQLAAVPDRFDLCSRRC